MYFNKVVADFWYWVSEPEEEVDQRVWMEVLERNYLPISRRARENFLALANSTSYSV